MRSNKLKASILGLAVVGVAVLSAGPAGTQDLGALSLRMMAAKGRSALDRWDYREALDVSDKMFELAAGEDDPEAMAQAHAFRAHYCFYKGDYACSRDEFEAVTMIRPLDEEGDELYKRVKRLAEVWDGSTEKSSAHFVIRYQPGRDQVLVDPALNSLEAAYPVMSSDFDVDPGNSVLVEIYPGFEDFSSATGISMEALENSGTIAVCKYRRMMINTPRNLLRGYAYLDTLGHEFVHFVVYRKYGKAVPIWLHEGLAKYEEDRWRGRPGGELSPSQKSLLASALRQDELISFDRMHPSFAYLKTPRQGQLAFAEVATVIDYIMHRGGWDMIFRLCDELVKGSGYREAIAASTGVSFDRFWEDWQAYVRKQKFEELPGMEISALEIRKGEVDFDEVDEEVGEEDMSEGEHWKYVRLGDLLRDRGHYRAASVEYVRAREVQPYSARILNKIGLCYFMAGEYEKSLEPLETGARIYPGHSTTHINLGRTLYTMEKYEEARKELETALEVNPFNPIPYNYLIKIYRAREDNDRVAELESDLEIISR